MSMSADGAIHCLQADPYIQISDQVLEAAPPDRISSGDGIVTFHFAEGDLSYGLLSYDDIREVHLARRSDWTAEDEDWTSSE